MGVINTSNALGAKVAFEFPQDVATLPYTDSVGGIVVSAVGGATIQMSAPGPAGQLDQGANKAFSTAAVPFIAAPFTLFTFFRMDANPGGEVQPMSLVLDDGNYFELAITVSPFNVRARARQNSSIISDAVSAGTMSFSTFYAAAAIFGSTTDTRVWFNGTMSAANTTSVAPAGTTGRKLGIGYLPRTTPNGFLTGYTKHSIVFNGALTDAELDSMLADPTQIYVQPTNVTGAVTLDDSTPSGTIITISSAQVTGLVTMGDSVPSGIIGPAPGTITSAPFKNWSGTLLAGATIPKVAFVRISDMVQVLALTNQVTNGSGVLAVTSAYLSAGTAYLLITCDAAGTAFGCEPYTAA